MTKPIRALASGLLAAWLCWLAVPALAATVADLYESQVPVAGEGVDARNAAIGQALERVLVKLTGRDPAPGAAELLAQAPAYVQQYRFVRSLSPDGEPRAGLWVRFDRLGLDRAVRQRGLPLWGESRPGMLVWLGAEQGGRRELVGPDSELAAALRGAAAARGLPVQWPLLDLEDQARLTTADLWSDYSESVSLASRRYAQPLVLTGRLRQVAADHWEGRWTLREGERSRALNSAGADADTAIVSAMGQVADGLAARYAPAGGDNGPRLVRVQITGVQGVRDYARVVKLVGDHELVSRVLLREAASDGLVLDVLARGGREALAQVLDLAHGLRREPDPQPPAITAPPPPVLSPVTSGEPAVPAAPAAPAEPGAAPVVDGGVPVVPVVPAAPPVHTPPPPVDLVYRVTL